MNFRNNIVGIFIVAILFLILTEYMVRYGAKHYYKQMVFMNNCAVYYPDSNFKKIRDLFPRGKLADLTADSEGLNIFKKENCLFTWWQVSHFLTYMLVGFLFPGFFLEAMVVSVAFEVYEDLGPSKCNDYLDLALNLTGFLVGKGLQEITWKAPPKSYEPISSAIKKCFK